ncbi:Hypothetical_protein [Hexamita inflata]|uniref:Hypothetical_protein n=1 Tax=Hexamita inflata TaxID=28002 RepID=A0AA86UDK7_9EUKA|nr:Hypothetical protein HINF_LOCUS25083 [Hexamita inflata]
MDRKQKFTKKQPRHRIKLMKQCINRFKTTNQPPCEKTERSNEQKQTEKREPVSEMTILSYNLLSYCVNYNRNVPNKIYLQKYSAVHVLTLSVLIHVLCRVYCSTVFLNLNEFNLLKIIIIQLTILYVMDIEYQLELVR